MDDEECLANRLTSQTSFWPWLLATGCAGWLVWPSAFHAAQAFGVLGYRDFDQAIFEGYLLILSMSVVQTLGPFVIFWAMCVALGRLTTIWCMRISTQIMIASLISIAAVVMLNRVGLYNVTDLDGWLLIQVLAFLPATVLGGIFGGVALFILRRMRARHLLTFAGVGFGVGLMIVILLSIPSIGTPAASSEITQSSLNSAGFWAFGGAMALSLIWFWWQTFEILRSQNVPHIR